MTLSEKHCSRKGEGKTDPTAVAIASCNQRMLWSVLGSLAGDERITVTGELAGTASMIAEFLEKSRPDVLLADREIINNLSLRSMQMIRERFPGVRILLLCSEVQPSLVRKVIGGGYHGFILRDQFDELAVRALLAVSRGDLWMPRAMLQSAIFDRVLPVSAYSERDFLSVLTAREAETVDCLCHGLTNKQIANELDIKEDTVKKHLRNVYMKLGIRRRAELMALRGLRPN